MRHILVTDLISQMAAQKGRTNFTLALPADAADDLADGADFMLVAEQPATVKHLVDAVTLAYANLIAADKQAREDGTYRYDAATGPIVSGLSVFRVDGELELIRPKGKDAKDKLIETLPSVVVQTRERYRASLPESLRGLVKMEAHKSWTDAQEGRAQKALPSATADAAEPAIVSDGKARAILFEDRPARTPFVLEAAEQAV